MPAYTERSIDTIQVPSASGVLSDEQYSSLSPASYKLDASNRSFVEAQGIEEVPTSQNTLNSVSKSL